MLLLVTIRPHTMSAFGGGSAAGPSHSRHFAATPDVGRFRTEADMNRQARPAAPVANDPTATSAKRQKLLVKQLTALPKVLL